MCSNNKKTQGKKGYIAVCEQVPTAMYNKKALLLQGFQTLGGRWDSTGEAEARIPLKIDIFLSLQPTINFPTASEKKQCAKAEILLYVILAIYRQEALTTKNAR